MSSVRDPNELMAEVAMMSAVKLLGVKVSFERLARFLSAIGAEGTYNGTDIHETLQGVHDLVSAALGYLVSPDEEAEIRKSGMLEDDAEFEKMISKLEEGGHA